MNQPGRVHSMRSRVWLAVITMVVTLSARTGADRAPAEPTGAERWWAHVKVLADDSMEGRDTGSPAHRRAAEYVAAQFRKAGLEPAGTDGFIQTVKLKTRRILEERSSLALVGNGTSQALSLGEDAN